MKPFPTVLTLLAAACLVGLGVVAGHYWPHGEATMDAAPTTAGDARTALYWYDPMVPAQHFDKPGKSPFMDMQLVPRYAEGGDDAASPGVRIDPALQQSVGIRTATVETGQLTTGLHVPGTLSWNLHEESVVSARADGIVTTLKVPAPYTAVSRGQALASVLAPMWSSARGEADALAHAQSADARALAAAAQQRLHVLGAQGGTGRDGSVTLSADRAGVVTEVMVRQGQAVTAGMPLFRINGSATLWLDAAIPQANIMGLAPGSAVEARVSALPGEVFHGQIDALLPQVDASSRTQTARIVLRNPRGQLAAGMFADVTLQPAAGPSVPLIPSEALIATGDDSRVIVATDEGHFMPVRVRTGRSSGGRTEILSGLSGGERVVVSGQFLVDSEASLSGALQRLGDTSAPTQVEDGAAMAMAMHNEGTGKAPACRVQYWYDPMKPDTHFDKPGRSPFMDMPLVPAYADDNGKACDAGAAMEMPQ
ncbi:efflux RND transporter periplasmic adaptor subunit [Stenotrophomonas sp. 24(2023)]|uniref:efflux RND transporter periplasmic adaptor subunit n=1 Tax=Stenotrophomonas sp. 24(2023) TaxID=3068324 RepID=UPI0031BA200F